MDTGGLAQMTFNNNNSSSANGNGYHAGNGLGAPGSGFASRGKGAHIKRLSVAPPQMNVISENDVDNTPAPRTSRSHLLAGLRTAPKTPGAAPASAPYHQTQHSFGMDASKYASRGNVRASHDLPQTATTASFPGLGMASGARVGAGTNQQGMYSYPEQVLAPPQLHFGHDDGDQMDPQVYDELMATNMYLMQRQQQLQEQLRNVTAAAHQFQHMNIGGRPQQQQQHHQHQQQQQQQQHQHQHQQQQQGYYGGGLNSSMSLYNQQFQSGVQPVVQPVPNQPGLYSVYNPLTNQHSFVVDPSVQQGHLPASPPNSTPGYSNGSPDQDVVGYFRRDNMSPSSAQVGGRNRAFTPPKQSPSPPHPVEPLPQPSANAYRPGHRKGVSSGMSGTAAGPKSAGIPATPMTGTFGPGMGRAGEHPMRQPRGPPAMEELKVAPTSKHEGSKNFATRQRRRAVFNLVRAGKERRTGRSGSRDAGASSSDGEPTSATGSESGSDLAFKRSWRASGAV